MKANFGIITPERCSEFVRKGYQQRCFFPHTIRYLPKCGPDGFRIARWMCGNVKPDQIWEVVIHAAPSLEAEFPRDLFFDDDIVWHQQQFGRPGQVATANLVVEGSELFTMVHISDVVQRISRRRQLKTRIENRFKGWNHMLLNGIVNFAQRLGLERVHVANSEWAMRHTDPARNVRKEMFQRVYDRNVNDLFDVSSSPHWWSIDLNRNADRFVVPEPGEEEITDDRIICICHDIERGLGHIDSDRAFALRAEAAAPEYLDRMLAIEREAGVKASYSVVGMILPELRSRIEQDGHCLAFHSWDHHIGPEQLSTCRSVDYRLKGYRPPQSVITPELSDENLCFHNFEWLANSSYMFGFALPRLENRIVKLPIHFDDFAMYHDAMPYDTWESQALAVIGKSHFTAFSLHDCYGEFWLPRYAEFLRKVSGMGKLLTLNQAADEVFLTNALSFQKPSSGEAASV